MYIRKDAADTYKWELNEDEHKAVKTILEKLIFNPEGVSNQFKLPQQDIDILRQIYGHLYTLREI